MTHSEMGLLVALFLVAFHGEAAEQTTATEATTTIPTTPVATTTMTTWPLTTMPISTSTTTATTITSTSASEIMTMVMTTARLIETTASNPVTSAVLESTLETTPERITEGTSTVTSTELTTTAETTTTLVTEGTSTVTSTELTTTAETTTPRTAVESTVTSTELTTTAETTTPRTAVESTVPPFCYPLCADDEVCIYYGGTPTCQCNSAFYLHANISDIKPTVTCESAKASIAISKCLLQGWHYDYQHMHYLNGSGDCTGAYRMERVDGRLMVIAEPQQKAGYCGNVVTITVDKVTYSNVLYIPSDTSSGIVYSNPLNLSFSCTYNLTMQTNLATTLYPLPSVLNSNIGYGTGSTNGFMAAYLTDSFTAPYNTTEPLYVGTPLYISITTEFSDGDIFALRADRCVASPTRDASINDVLLINNGCAVNQEVNTQWLSNGESLEVRFSVVTFVFQGYPEVYIACDVRLCEKAAENCDLCSRSMN